jgi:L-iditol 2-dehydrogenase
MADIAANRLDFARKHEFADDTQVLSVRQSSSTLQSLAFAQEDASALAALNSRLKFHVVFECSGVESCVRTAIYVSVFPWTIWYGY